MRMDHWDFRETLSPDNSLLVACGDAVVVVAMQNAAIVDDVAVANSIGVGVGAAAALVVWVQQRWMRPCTSLQSHFVSVVVTLMGKEPSWWYRQTTQGPHSTMEWLVCCQP